MKLHKIYSMKIGHKLMFGMVFMAIMPMLLVGYLSFQKAKKAIIESKIVELQSYTHLQVMQMKILLDENANKVEMLRKIPAFQGWIRAVSNGGVDSLDGSTQKQWSSRLEQVFNEMLKTDNNYLNINYFDKYGNEVVKVGMKIDSSDFQEQWLSLKKIKMLIIRKSINNQLILRYIVPIVKSNSIGEVEGILQVDILGNDLQEVINIQSKDQLWKGYWINTINNDVLACSDCEFEFDIDDFNKRLIGDKSKQGLVKRDDGVIFYELICASENKMDSQCTMVVEFLSSRVWSLVIRNMKTELFLLLSIGSILILSFVILFSNSLSSPISKLSKTATALSKGNLLARAKIRSMDEIGNLAKIFNQMADSILEMQADLEEKVEVRTSELEKQKKRLENNQRAILNILEDVEQEKEKSMRLAQEMRRFKTAVEASSEMMAFTDADGIVLWGNKAVKTITGFSASEAKGKKAGVLWGKLMEKKWYENLWRTVKKDKKVFAGEIVNHRKNGEKFIAWLTIYPLLNKEGEVEFLVATQRDITHEKAVDQMKTDFISLASHQLRTPLSAMKWFLEMLLDGDMGKLSKEQMEAIKNIDLSNERMIALVNALLNVSRIESGRIIVEPEKTDLSKLVKSVVGELEEKFELKQQEVKVKLVKKMPEIMIDPRLIRQVVMNLLTNANKYTPEKGKIRIELDQTEKDVVVMVKDSGMGIPKKDQKRLFERFFRASNVIKQETDGTGLGLYLAKIIVESSGGEMWFESEEGKGTTFWFSIPKKGMKAKKGEVRLS